MATPKKKHLIELMIEAGVKWPDGAEYAAQDKNKELWFFEHKKPWLVDNRTKWYGSDEDRRFAGDGVELPSLCRKWHQTIVTREQYEEALAEHTGAITFTGKSNQVRESEDIPPSRTAPKYCASVMRQMPDNTIEQLTADYHTKAAEADRLQSVADEALKAADDVLIALEKAGELIGLLISIDAKTKFVEQQTEPEQPEITDWRDLLVGDVIWIGKSPSTLNAPPGEYQVVGIDFENSNQPFAISWSGGEAWPDIAERGWRFIRRP